MNISISKERVNKSALGIIIAIIGLNIGRWWTSRKDRQKMIRGVSDNATIVVEIEEINKGIDL